MTVKTTTTVKPQRKKRPTANRDQLRQEFYRAIDAGELSIVDTVKGFRYMLGMNQHEFAKFTGVAPRLLIAFEQGVGNPTLKTLAKLTKGTGLELRLVRKKRAQ